MKKSKSVDDNYVFQTASSLATPASTQEASYAMPMTYFVGQTPPPSSVHTGPVRLVHVTGQTSLSVFSRQTCSGIPLAIGL